jgi:hypothetical protein
MMPARCHNRIRSVTLYHNRHSIWGFFFFDKEGALLWKIGNTDSWFKTETVLLEENEVIVGVVAKLLPGYQSMYTDF